MSERQDVAAAGLGLVEAVLRAAPQLLLPSPQLPQALGWCCAAAGVREGAPVAAAVSLLHRLVNPQPGGVTSPTHFQVWRGGGTSIHVRCNTWCHQYTSTTPSDGCGNDQPHFFWRVRAAKDTLPVQWPSSKHVMSCLCVHGHAAQCITAHGFVVTLAHKVIAVARAGAVPAAAAVHQPAGGGHHLHCAARAVRHGAP